MTTQQVAISNCLTFNPVSDSYHTLNDGYPIDITPAMARYILVNHNKENRPVSKTQVIKSLKALYKMHFMKMGTQLPSIKMVI